MEQLEQQVPATPEHEPTNHEPTNHEPTNHEPTNTELAQLAEMEQIEQVEEIQEALTISTEPTSVGEVSAGLPSSIILPTEPIKKREGKVDITSKGEIRFYATGRRKEAVARVWLIPGGTGQIIVNDRPLPEYLTRISLYEEAIEPFRLTNSLGIFDVKATAKGGGLHSQAGALRLGIARALVVWNEELRPILRRHGLLTRDPRAKERKKYGYKRARRGFQFRKR